MLDLCLESLRSGWLDMNRCRNGRMNLPTHHSASPKSALSSSKSYREADLFIKLTKPAPAVPTATTPLIPAQIHVSSSAASLPTAVSLSEAPHITSVPEAKGKFKDLDAFLDSDDEEEDESEEDRSVISHAPLLGSTFKPLLPSRLSGPLPSFAQ